MMSFSESISPIVLFGITVLSNESDRVTFFILKYIERRQS